MSEVKYGVLILRIKAIVVDSLVLMGFGIAASSILSKFDNVPVAVRIIVFLFIFILYDPIFTCLVGGTIGHLIMGLRVRQSKDETRKIIFPFAVLRFIFKVLLGWISLVTVPGDEKKKAIHDSIAGSVVIQD